MAAFLDSAYSITLNCHVSIDTSVYEEVYTKLHDEVD